MCGFDLGVTSRTLVTSPANKIKGRGILASISHCGSGVERRKEENKVEPLIFASRCLHRAVLLKLFAQKERFQVVTVTQTFRNDSQCHINIEYVNIMVIGVT